MDSAATKIQAHVRRRRDSESVQYVLAAKALSHMESKAESDALEVNRSLVKTAAVLANQGQDVSPRLATPVHYATTAKPGPVMFFPLDADDESDASVPRTTSGKPRIHFSATPNGGVELSRDSVAEILQYIKTPDSPPLGVDCMRRLIVRGTELVRRQVTNALLELTTPPSPGRLVVLGDTHGQLNDVLWIFFKNGEPSSDNVYIFNGDVVDRGKKSVDILIAILMFKLWDPTCIHLNRGNHEDRSMNESYGFLDECVEKWGVEHGVELFELFNTLFESLPLFMLVDKSTFIVHGGLWRHNCGLTQLRRLAFRRPIPEPGQNGLTNPGDAIFFDSLWADPQAGRGFGVSPRGPNIITWGPDVTDRFLRGNSLRLLVRSHEVPTNGRGFQYHHDGRCLTIFSASNYCGQVGNLGSVLILHRDQEVQIEEHWAPSMQELADAEGAFARIKQQASQRSRRRCYSEAMEAEVLRRVQELIVKHKPELFEYWSLVDTSPRGVFSIAPSVWRDGCAAVLDNELPWVRLQEVLGVVGPGHMVHYVKFLTRYRVAFEANYGLSASGWERAVWSRIMEMLLHADLPLREALAALDVTNNGLVSPVEFSRLLESCRVDITSVQARALLRTFAAHAGETSGGAGATLEVSLWDMLARLQGSLPVAPALVDKDPEMAKWAVSKLHIVSEAVLEDARRRLCETDANPKEWPDARLLAVWFEDADASQNGYLECGEFVQALQRIGTSLEKRGCPSDAASLARVGKYCDIAGNGRVNYFELLNALTWEESIGPEFKTDMFETINGAIYFNQATIRRALQQFDPELRGTVTPGNFVTAVRAVQTALVGTQGADGLTAVQIETIADHIPRERDNTINYDKFLNSFKIVDTFNFSSD